MPLSWQLCVASVHVWPLRIPVRVPQHLASETITHAEGHSGWGEASAAPIMTGEVVAGMAEVARRYLAPALLATPLDDLEAITQRLDRAIRANRAAKCAVDTKTQRVRLMSSAREGAAAYAASQGNRSFPPGS